MKGNILMEMLPKLVIMVLAFGIALYFAGMVDIEDVAAKLDERPDSVDETELIEGITQNPFDLDEVKHYCAAIQVPAGEPCPFNCIDPVQCQNQGGVFRNEYTCAVGQCCYLSGSDCVTPENSPHQGSEVACEISNKIYKDFYSKGNVISRSNSRGGNCLNDKCIIGAAKFTLAPPSNANIDFWEQILLGWNCHYCSEAGEAMVFDEICLNLNFKDKIENKLFCSEPIILQLPKERTEQTSFGNSDCGEALLNPNPMAWTNFCDGSGNDDFCQNPENKIIWIAENNQNGIDTLDNEYRVKDNADYSKANNWFLNEYPYQYGYGIFWDDKNDRYEVHFERIPLSPDSGNIISADDLYNNDYLGNVMNDYQRYNFLGNWYGEARTVEQGIVTNNLGFPLGLNDIRLALEAYTGADIDKCRYCTEEDDCIYTEPEILDITGKKAGESLEEFFGKQNIVIKTNIGGACTGALEPNKEYQVIVKNWFGGKIEISGVPMRPFPKLHSIDRTIIILENS